MHTLLSPCAGVEMIPPLIVQEAVAFGLHLIAITDHNATANIAAVQKAAEGTDLRVLPGVELQTREEVHSLCLFDTLEQTTAFQAYIDQHLPNTANNPDFFGEQFVVDETGDFLRREDRLLLASTDVSIEEAFREVTRLGGLMIPAHVNRSAYGLLTMLGFVPPELPLEALEISRHLKPEQAVIKFRALKGYPLIQNGDVHFLDGFLGSTYFQVEAPTLTELRQALAGQNGRSFRIIVDNSLPE